MGAAIQAKRIANNFNLSVNLLYQALAESAVLIQVLLRRVPGVSRGPGRRRRFDCRLFGNLLQRMFLEKVPLRAKRDGQI
jgi:hypothetical protein